jgi:hypothetical protein
LCQTKTRVEGNKQGFVKALYRHGNPVITGVGFLQLLERGRMASNIAGSLETFYESNTKGMQDMEGRYCSSPPLYFTQTK